MNGKPAAHLRSVPLTVGTGVTHIPNDVGNHERVGLSHLGVYYAVAFYDHRNGAGCYAQISTIAKKARVGQSGTRKALHDLVNWD